MFADRVNALNSAHAAFDRVDLSAGRIDAQHKSLDVGVPKPSLPLSRGRDAVDRAFGNLGFESFHSRAPAWGFTVPIPYRYHEKGNAGTVPEVPSIV